MFWNEYRFEENDKSEKKKYLLLIKKLEREKLEVYKFLKEMKPVILKTLALLV